MKRGLVLALSLAALLGLGFVDPPYERLPKLRSAGCALVLSGDVDYRRVGAAATLYRSGAVPALLLTGAGVGGDSAAEMAKRAVAAGVPLKALTLEERSTSTLENLLLASPLVQAHGWRRIALVTSASHMGRAIRAARRAMPDVTWLPVAIPDPAPARRVYATRLAEWGKLVYYGARGWL